jgi:hypothetical protein
MPAASAGTFEIGAVLVADLTKTIAADEVRRQDLQRDDA